MRRSFRLTRQAEDSLVDIALWTIETFGAKQAALYEAELIARCHAIAEGNVLSRDCSMLVGDDTPLRYVRAGEHFVVFAVQPDEIIVIDILHSRSDLPRHIKALSALNENRE